MPVLHPLSDLAQQGVRLVAEPLVRLHALRRIDLVAAVRRVAGAAASDGAAIDNDDLDRIALDGALAPPDGFVPVMSSGVLCGDAPLTGGAWIACRPDRLLLHLPRTLPNVALAACAGRELRAIVSCVPLDGGGYVVDRVGEPRRSFGGVPIVILQCPAGLVATTAPVARRTVRMGARAQSARVLPREAYRSPAGASTGL